MKQLTQELGSGHMELLEVPFPSMEKDEILVWNHYSVISAGTESKSVSDARKGYIAKARSRQKEVRMVINTIKSEGLKKTYDIVMNKLSAPSPLGYSCAGEVIAVGDAIKDIRVGDHVACGGDSAFHSEVVTMKRNLCVKVDPSVDLRYAAFSTIAAIAIQGIRQADLRFGENCVIIGLGLIGQLTVQILQASGIKAIGIDIDPHQVEAARRINADLALTRNQEGLVKTIMANTGGYGTDAVIITAATTSLDPIELAGELARKKGKVVIVGAVPTGFSRANYYRKELDLRMSSSYGPGRYDNEYELKSHDYPIGYVRFTENRNMQTFVDFLFKKKLDMEKLITHEFPFENAFDAYQLILDKSEPFAGVILKYDQDSVPEKKPAPSSKDYPSTDVNVGLIGAGSFAQGNVLPVIKDKCNLVGVVTKYGNESAYIAKKYKLDYCTESVPDLLADNKINTIFVLTRHNLHAINVMNALKAGKNVFVEKPLAMTIEELQLIKELYEQSDGIHLMLGFNRRFSPLVKKIKEKFLDTQAKSITIRVNAGYVPPDHWVHDPEVGGGRIIGEACHFIDLAMFLAGSPIKKISAFGKNEANRLSDTLTINLSFHNDSIANICYFSNGNNKVPKENIEVYCDGTIMRINDFKELIEYGKGVKKTSIAGQDKGHKTELTEFINSIKQGLPTPIPFDQIYDSTLATFKVIESIQSGRTTEL